MNFWERVGWPYGHVCVMFVAYWVVCCWAFWPVGVCMGHVVEGVHVVESVGGLFGG